MHLQLSQGIGGEAEVPQLSGEPQGRRGDGGQEVVAEVQADEVVEAAEADTGDLGNVGAGEDKLLDVDQPVCSRPPDKGDDKISKRFGEQNLLRVSHLKGNWCVICFLCRSKFFLFMN
jgi:hypothetical protein